MEKIVRLKKNEDHRIVDGHLWAFSNEIEKIEGEPQAGDIAQLRNYARKFLGSGFYNPQSLIAFRLLTRTEEELSFDFFRKRIETALLLRRKLFSNSETFRLVHGEGDYLPGLVIDKYTDLISVQTFSAGMDRRQTLICDVLESLLHPAGIVERNESAIRSLEGLEQRKGILRGSVRPVTISEYGIKYEVDLLEGQKTGLFLDQSENRKSIRRYPSGARVLDCFCNDGGFALNAATGEAKEVIAVDVSEQAIKRAQGNAILNAVQDRVKFVARDAFEYLKEAADKQKFDLVILDPPSFTKSKKTVQQGIRGYKELHAYAFRLLNSRGILATASCSHHIYEDRFLQVINESARAAGRRISQLEWRGASPDHPVLPAMPETRYLKFGIFHVE